MNGLPEPPNRGEPIRAELIRQMLDYMRRITPVAGPNIKVSIGPGGAKIEGTPGGEARAEARAPWTIRRHVTEGDADGQWEIWLPPGCMSVGGDCAPLNKPASEKAGHEDDAANWYAFQLDESAGDPTRTESEEGDGGETTTVDIREFSVIAHGKTSAKEYGVDALDDPARRLLFVDARKTPSDAEEASATDAERVYGTWGDEFAQTVGMVTIPVANETTSRKITASCRTPISVAARERASFDLVWYFKFGDDGSLGVANVYCVRQAAAAAGIGLTGETMSSVMNASEIYALVNTTALTTGQGIVHVLKDPSNVDAPSPYLTWLKLYDLTANAVTADYRQQSLVNIQLFHA